MFIKTKTKKALLTQR